MIEELIFSDIGLGLIGLLLVVVGYDKREKVKDWLNWHLFKYDYPVRIMVFKKRGDGYITRMDKGKKKTDKDGKDFYDTIRCGKIPRIEVAHMTADGWVVLKEIKPGQYVQVEMTGAGTKDGVDGVQAVDFPLSEASKGWYSTSTKAKFRYKKMDAWNYVMPLLVLVVFIIGSIILAGYIWSPVIGSMQTLSSSQAQIAVAQASMAEMVNKTCYNLKYNRTFTDELATGGSPVDRGEVPY